MLEAKSTSLASHLEILSIITKIEKAYKELIKNNKPSEGDEQEYEEDEEGEDETGKL